MVRWLFVAAFSLAAVGFSHSAVRVWDGGAGANFNHWLTPANWVGDVAPSPGDILAFPAEAPYVLSNNNFPANTSFHSLLLSNTYHFIGASITLNSGITVFSTDDPHAPTFWLPITLNAPQAFGVQAEIWSELVFLAPINTQSHELTLATFGTHGRIEIKAGIAGGGGIQKTGPGRAYLLSPTNTFSGITHIWQGKVLITNGTALGSTAAGSIVEPAGELALMPGTFVVSEPLTLGGKLTGGGNSVWSAPIHLPGPIAHIRATNGSFVIRGEISGPGGLFVPRGDPVFAPRGDPLLLDAPTNTYQGPTEIGGHVVINAFQPQSDVLFAGTYLGGRGSIGNVTTTGILFKTVAPGTNGVGTLTARGLALDSKTTVTIEINGAVAAMDNSIQVNGSVSLANARLQLTSRSVSWRSDQQFTLISNDGTDPVIGTFLNLPEGALVVSNTAWLRITYSGGPGNNDVVLYPGNPPNPYWDGGGNDNFWTNPANWIGNVAPQPGDALVFPELGYGSTNYNDFPPGTSFHSIYVDTEAVFEGNMVALNAGLKVLDDTEIAFHLRLNAPQTFFVDDDGSLVISGGIDAAGHDLTIDCEDTFITVPSSISGAGGLIIEGGGRIYLHANSFAGRTELRSGDVFMLHSQSLGSTTGDTLIGTSGRLHAAAGLTIAEPLTLAGSLFGSAVYNGPIHTIDGSIYRSNDEVVQINGPISGGNLTFFGTGTTILTGTNTHTGQTVLGGGTLFVNGSQLSSTTLVEGTLGGVGRVGAIRAGVQPGTLSPGTNSIGTFTTGDLALNPYATVSLAINNIFPVTYDRLLVNGSVRLDNATLFVSLNFTPAAGDSFIIIDNDGNDAVQGNFLFLPEGAALNVNGHSLRLSYAGGDGNDVVLTVGPAFTTVRLWDGGGADSFWSTAANWLGDLRPQPGDHLGFPANAARRINTNDFPANTPFGSVTLVGSIISGDSYSLYGQPVTLLGGIADTRFGGRKNILLPINLAADQTFEVLPIRRTKNGDSLTII